MLSRGKKLSKRKQRATCQKRNGSKKRLENSFVDQIADSQIKAQIQAHQNVVGDIEHQVLVLSIASFLCQEATELNRDGNDAPLKLTLERVAVAPLKVLVPFCSQPLKIKITNAFAMDSLKEEKREPGEGSNDSTSKEDAVDDRDTDRRGTSDRRGDSRSRDRRRSRSRSRDQNLKRFY